MPSSVRSLGALPDLSNTRTGNYQVKHFNNAIQLYNSATYGRVTYSARKCDEIKVITLPDLSTAAITYYVCTEALHAFKRTIIMQYKRRC